MRILSRLRVMAFRCLVVIAALVVVARGGETARAAAPKWIEVRSANFLLQGNASDRELREVARRLEEFREVLSRGLPKTSRVSTTAPTVVLVFGSRDTYEPFKPATYRGKTRENMAGFFVPGDDRNYLTMTTDSRVGDPYPVAFHELTHLVVQANVPDAPLWLNEGLAEFYRSFTLMKGGKEAIVGEPMRAHMLLLSAKFLPLADVVAADYNSPLYTGADSDVFYAESWALLHYLTFERKTQFNEYVARVLAGTPSDKALQEAFAEPLAKLQDELRNYVFYHLTSARKVTIGESVALQVDAPPRPMAEAEVEARLGDLLLHLGRYDDADARLQAALKLDPKSVLALTARGNLAVRQRSREGAVTYLRAATVADPESFDAWCGLGTALVRYGEAPGLAELEEGRKAFERARQLRPASAEAAAGVAAALLLSQERLEEAQTLAEQAVASEPNDPDFGLLLAQVLLARGEFASAREHLGPFMASRRTEVRDKARALMTTAVTLEQQAAVARTSAPASDPGKDQPARLDTGETIDSPAADGMIYRTRKPKDGEQRVFGTLLRVECSPREAVFHLKRATEEVLFVSAHPETIQLLSFRADLKMGCGTREPAEPVYVTFRPAAKSEPTAGSAAPQRAAVGEVVAIDFMPPGYVPKDQK